METQSYTWIYSLGNMNHSLHQESFQNFQRKIHCVSYLNQNSASFFENPVNCCCSPLPQTYLVENLFAHWIQQNPSWVETHPIDWSRLRKTHSFDDQIPTEPHNHPHRQHGTFHDHQKRSMPSCHSFWMFIFKLESPGVQHESTNALIRYGVIPVHHGTKSQECFFLVRLNLVEPADWLSLLWILHWTRLWVLFTYCLLTISRYFQKKSTSHWKCTKFRFFELYAVLEECSR